MQVYIQYKLCIILVAEFNFTRNYEHSINNL